MSRALPIGRPGYYTQGVHALLEPWIALRVALGLITSAVWCLACWPSFTALRRFNVVRASEGQLLLERRFELACAAGKLGAWLLIAQSFVTVVAAVALHPQIRGAMCPYGLFAAGPDGFASVRTDLLAALLAGVYLQMHAVDASVARLDLVRPLAMFTVGLAFVSLLSLSYAGSFWLTLDRDVTASCCSLELDEASVMLGTGESTLSWYVLTAGGVAMLFAATTAFLAAKKPSRRSMTLAVVACVIAVPLAILAVIHGVAPHVFETPTHHCPFCLLRADAWFLGYPLFAGILYATAHTAGAFLAARVSPRETEVGVVTRLAPRMLGAAALSWMMVLLLSVAPVARYAMLYEGSLIR